MHRLEYECMNTTDVFFNKPIGINYFIHASQSSHLHPVIFIQV